MSSQAVQANLILIRRLADGKVEWIPYKIPRNTFLSRPTPLIPWWTGPGMKPRRRWCPTDKATTS